VPQSEVQALSGRGLLDHVGVPVESIADCGADEIGPIRVESLLDHQVDMAEVDEAEIDRDLLGFAPLWAQFMHTANHPSPPSKCHPTGWYMSDPLGISRGASTMLSV